MTQRKAFRVPPENGEWRYKSAPTDANRCHAEDMPRTCRRPFPDFGIRLRRLALSCNRILLGTKKEDGTLYCTPKVGHFWGVFYEI